MGRLDFDQIAHMDFEGFRLLQREAVDAFGFEFAVQAGTQGVLDREAGGGMEILDGLGQKEGQGAHIDLHAARRGHGDESDDGIDVEGVAKRDQLVVDERAEIGQSRGGFDRLAAAVRPRGFGRGR